MFYLFKYKELISTLVKRELKSRYRGSFFGYLWSFFNPIILLLIYSIVFSYIFKPRIEGIENYPLFLFIGILPWIWFSSSLNESCNCYQENSGILKKVYFPLEIIPLVKVLSNGIHFLLALPVLFLILFFSKKIYLTFIFFPISFIFQGIFTYFLSIIVGIFGVFFKDLKDILSNFLNFLFFATPIIYTIDMIPKNFLRKLILINPMTHFLNLWQKPIFFGKIPGFISFFYIIFLLFLFGFLAVFLFKKQREFIVEKI